MSHSEPFRAVLGTGAECRSPVRSTGNDNTHAQQGSLRNGCTFYDCPEPTEATGACRAHRASVARELDGGAAYLYVELNLALQPGRTGNDDPKTSSSKVKHLPINGDARAVQEGLLAVLLGWEVALRLEQGWMATPRRGREGPTLVTVCELLHRFLDEALQVTDAHLYGERLLNLRRNAESALGRTRSKRNRLDLPCGDCGQRSLARVNGTDETACLYCGAVLSAQQVDELLDPPSTREAA